MWRKRGSAGRWLYAVGGSARAPLFGFVTSQRAALKIFRSYRRAARDEGGLFNSRRRRTSTRTRRNPRGVVIGDSALELRYKGGQGKRSRKMLGPWRHPFESPDVQILGNKDGSLSLRSKSGERLWDFFEV